MLSWSKNKENKLVKLYPYNTDEEVARIMNLSVSFVQRMADKLGLEKEEPSKREWTNDEVEYINRLYASTPNEQLANSLHSTKSEIEHTAYRMGLRKQYDVEPDSYEQQELIKRWSEEWNSKMGCSRGHYLTWRMLNVMFPHYAVKEEEPVGRLWIDLFIPQLGIAFEIHGQQHTEFNSFFHSTQDAFKRGQENDWQKSEMLESQDISLVVIYHDENLSFNLINRKIAEVL